MDKAKEINEWIYLAKQDLDTAMYLQSMHPIPVEIICFHCQQSAEKYLKAFLISRNSIIKKTHKLETLLIECMKYSEKFIDLKMPCIRLSGYSVEIRYPYRIELDESMMKLALSDAKAVQEFALKMI